MMLCFYGVKTRPVSENDSIQSYIISTEGMDQNFCPSLQESYYSTVTLIPGT